MATIKPHIDPYLFERQFEAFTSFVEEHSAVPFVSFASNSYIEAEEGDKYKIHYAGRESLALNTWKQSDIGTGKIVDAVIAAIELRTSNLVPWQSRYGEKARPHQPLYDAKNHREQLPGIESSLFKLYRKEQDEEVFAELLEIFGKQYSLLAYLYFLKDRSKYLPIRPTTFDRAFEYLGADFKTTSRCSWENYSIYVYLIEELKTLLTESLGGEVTLLDAHSFAWMLAAQMAHEKRLANVTEYQSLAATEREAIVKARIGQGRFRQDLINYWSGCAVTGCREVGLLRASHIKPWAEATLTERLSLYNGLLLSPTLDACFDSGYVSFDDDGQILLTERLTAEDSQRLGINASMRLRRIDSGHKKYLAFHREHVFNKRMAT